MQIGPIEDGIPIPPSQRSTWRRLLGQMQPGQSRFFGTKEKNSVTLAARDIFGKGNYAVRTVAGGIRVWRKA